MSAMVVYLWNNLTLKESFAKLWNKIVDGTIANDISQAVTVGRKEMFEMAPRALKFMVFQGEEYNTLMNSDMPVGLKRMLQVSITMIELGGSKIIKDGELLMGFEILSGYFAPTIPNSWAGFGGYYFRQYTDAFFVLPAKGESYNIYNLSPIIWE